MMVDGHAPPAGRSAERPPQGALVASRNRALHESKLVRFHRPPDALMQCHRPACIRIVHATLPHLFFLHNLIIQQLCKSLITLCNQVFLHSYHLIKLIAMYILYYLLYLYILGAQGIPIVIVSPNHPVDHTQQPGAYDLVCPLAMYQVKPPHVRVSVKTS